MPPVPGGPGEVDAHARMPFLQPLEGDVILANAPVEESLHQLVEAIRRGDAAAEERLIMRFGRGVELLLDRHTGGRPEREDLYQETFRLLLEKLRAGELREPAKLPGFAAQLAKNLAIEHYRKTARRKTEPAPPEELDRPTRGGALDDLLAAEHAALARRVIGELGTSRDRDLLLRFYIAEEDRDALCAELGLSGTQFNKVLHRARQRYKELYLSRVGQTAQVALASLASLLTLLLPWSDVPAGALTT